MNKIVIVAIIIVYGFCVSGLYRQVELTRKMLSHALYHR